MYCAHAPHVGPDAERLLTEPAAVLQEVQEGSTWRHGAYTQAQQVQQQEVRDAMYRYALNCDLLRRVMPSSQEQLQQLQPEVQQQETQEASSLAAEVEEFRRRWLGSGAGAAAAEGGHRGDPGDDTAGEGGAAAGANGAAAGADGAAAGADGAAGPDAAEAGAAGASCDARTSVPGSAAGGAAHAGSPRQDAAMLQEEGQQLLGEQQQPERHEQQQEQQGQQQVDPGSSSTGKRGAPADAGSGWGKRLCRRVQVSEEEVAAVRAAVAAAVAASAASAATAGHAS
jgi:hypothetical protein